MDKQTLARLFGELEPVLAQNGYELLDIRWLNEQGRGVLRVYIDHLPQPIAGNGDTIPEAEKTVRRIMIEDCSRVSRLIDPILEVSDVLKGRYLLEVSSPGLDRPLRTQRAFERAIGEGVRIKLAAPVEERRNFKGTLLAVEAGRIRLQDETNRDYVLPWELIEQAAVIGRI